MGAWVCISRPMGRLRTIPLLTSKELSSWEGFLDFKNEKYVVSYLGRAQHPLDCHATDILEFVHR